MTPPLLRQPLQALTRCSGTPRTAALQLQLHRPVAFSTMTPRLQSNGETPARSHRPRSASQHPSSVHSKDEAMGVSPITGLSTAQVGTGQPVGNASTQRTERAHAAEVETLADSAGTVAAHPAAATSPTASSPVSSGAVPSSVPASSAATPAGPSTPLQPHLYAPTALPPRADPLLGFFTNLLMKSGNKAQAERHVAHTLQHVQALTHASPLPLVHAAVEAVRPLVKMQGRKQGGKNLQVPVALTRRQSTRKALVWIIEASKRRGDREVARRLAAELVAVVEGSSGVNARKEEQHKMAMANRANASVRI